MTYSEALYEALKQIEEVSMDQITEGTYSKVIVENVFDTVKEIRAHTALLIGWLAMNNKGS